MRRAVFIAVGVLAAILVILVLSASFWVNWLWFGSLDLRGVLLTRYTTQAALFAGGALISGLFFALNVRYAGRQLIGSPVGAQGRQVVLAPRLVTLARRRAA